MKKPQIYRHYKNKPYRILGEGKHSETLEDLVFYECLYENQLAKLWVRPKEMFYGTTEVNGQLLPRFAPVEIKIINESAISISQFDAVRDLIETTFKSFDWNRLASCLAHQTGTRLWLAKIEEKAVGFKLGYELNKSCFYSWLGAVDNQYRRIGVASSLMQAQHQWCMDQGYERIQTKSQNQWKEMLILNLRHGFDIVRCELDASQDPERQIKIVMEKPLTNRKF